MIYSKSALKAASLVAENKTDPIEAWKKAVMEEFPNSISSQEKGCPKNTFLGLCQEGKIKHIAIGKYTKSDLNKRYAVTAIQILVTNKTKAFTPLELWKAVLQKLKVNLNKRHISQMNIVLTLWKGGLIRQL